jgi:hypothetical protein
LEPWTELVYVLTSLSRPGVTVETGVFDGLSSAVVLQALQDNGRGILISIDPPATKVIAESTHRMREKTLPPNCQPGWAIPDYLRNRHRLFLGDSRTLLPEVLEQHPRIDSFLHDSLHTYEHQLFEYENVWPHLSTNDLLMSDDIFWSPAFHRFAKRTGHSYMCVFWVWCCKETLGCVFFNQGIDCG